MCCSHVAMAKSCHPREAEAIKSLVIENTTEKNLCVSQLGSRIILVWVGLVHPRLDSEGPSAASTDERTVLYSGPDLRQWRDTTD